MQDVAYIKPMLAGTIEKPFDDIHWVFEKKYDGYRTIAVIDVDEVQLFSRNELSFTSKYDSIVTDLKQISHTAVLDGEVVVEDKSGRSGFQLLQNYLKTGKGNLKYYAFDLLNLDGNDVTQFSLLERKQLLELLISKQKLSHVFYSKHTQGKSGPLFEKAMNEKSEGIMAKKAESAYIQGERSKNWLKIKIFRQEEVVIIGITKPKNRRKYFGALLLAQYDAGKLRYIGKCGTGFNDSGLKELHEKFQPHFTEESPLSEEVPLRESIQWIAPVWVGQIKFTERTESSYLRHPVFLGLRVDKKAKEVVFQSEIKNSVALKEISMDKDENTLQKKGKKDYDLKIGKTTLHFTNQDKIYFPSDGITKGDIVSYYNEVAELILPYIKNRPQSMNRFPNGINAASFYQKDLDVSKTPTWLKTESLFSESNDANIDYLICNDKATLLYMANLGCIDINPWNSTIQNIDNPDWVVIDIDPEKEDFKEVVKTALTVKEVMDELETDCYCKTSGATGLHVYIPLGAKYDYDSVKILAELIAKEIQDRLPDTTSLERSIKKRNHKIYIDYLQNRKGQTLAAPYCVRPKPGATVSVPLDWSEVNTKLSPSEFTIKNVMKRFEKKGDLWKPVLGKGADITAILKKMEAKHQD